MIHRVRLHVIVIVAAATGLLHAGPAVAASVLGMSGGLGMTAVSQGLVTLSTTLAGTPTNFTCPVTLTGTLEGMVEKIAGLEAGRISAATVGTCNRSAFGTVTAAALFTRPTSWKLRYDTFTGSLPNPNGLRATIEGAQFLFNIPGVGTACLYAGDIPVDLGFAGRSPNTSGLLRTLANTLALSATLSGICPSAASMTGTFSVTPQRTMSVLAGPAVSMADMNFAAPGTANELIVNAGLPIGVIDIAVMTGDAGQFSVRRTCVILIATHCEEPVTFHAGGAGTYRSQLVVTLGRGLNRTVTANLIGTR